MRSWWLAWLGATLVALTVQAAFCGRGLAWEHPPSRELPLLGHAGAWDLERLDLAPLGFTSARKRETASVGFRLPDGAAQPRPGDTSGLNYLIRLESSIVVQRTSGSGQLILSGMVNGCAGAQIVVDVHRPKGSAPEIQWYAGGLIHGVVGKRVRSDRFRAGLTNYLPYCGIKGGRNLLTVQLERLGEIQARVDLLPTSGIIVTPLAPAHLALEVDTAAVKPVVGEPTDFRVRVKNSGDRIAEDVALRVNSSSPLLDVVSEPESSFRSIGSKARTMDVRLDAEATGTYTIALRARSSNSNDPFTRIQVDVGSAGDDGSFVSWPLGVAWFCAVGGAAGLWARAWRREN